MERVGNESLDQGILDDEALREVFLSGDLEASMLFVPLLVWWQTTQPF